MPLEFDGVNGIIKNTTSDGDVTIKGNDGGSEISALILDMSAEGGATFNNWLEIPDYIYHTADSNTYFGFNANDNFELFAGGTDRLSIVGSETVFNDGSADKDFRVESDNDTHAFFIQGSNGSVGFGTSTMTTDFNVAGAAAFTTTGTTSNFKIISSDAGAATAPDLILYRNSSSPADNDFMGRLDFRGNDDAGNETDYISMYARATDVSNGSETSHFQIQDAQGTSLLELSTTSGTAEAVFNEDSANIDFRVESNGKTHMLFVDGGNDRVGIGTTPDLGDGLHIRKADSGQSAANSNFGNLVIENSAHAGISIFSGTSSDGAIYFGDSGGNNRGQIKYQHGGDNFAFSTADGATSLNISSIGAVTKPLQPAFSVQPSSNQNNISHNTTIAFGTEIFDQNADFASNTFTAPVTGKYQLSFNVRLQELQSDSGYVLINISTSNRLYQHILAVAPHTDGDVGYQHFSNSLLCDMDANDTALLNFQESGGTTGQVDVSAAESSFTGYLAC